MPPLYEATHGARSTRTTPPARSHDLVRPVPAQTRERREHGERHPLDHPWRLKAAESLAAKGALRAPLDAAAAADILWSLNDPYLFDALTTARRWSADRYKQWLGDLLCEQLLA